MFTNKESENARQIFKRGTIYEARLNAPLKGLQLK